MKKILIFITILISLQLRLVYSQNLIAVQNGSNPAFYQQVDSAIFYSQDGDTIYIPGGAWNITQPINKSLHIIGVGYHPDSTLTTFPTILTGNITLLEGASNGSLTGVSVNGGGITGSNDVVNYYTITRCHAGICLFQSNSNFTFIENFIGGISFNLTSTGNPSNCSFFNNVLGGTTFYSAERKYFVNSSFKNNIFLDGASCWLSCHYAVMSIYSLFENNIFIGANDGGFNPITGVASSIFKNNLFVASVEFPYNTNVGLNNIVSQNPDNIFEVDYHLQSTSSGINAGTDGTDIGLFGGVFPWKEGSIPSNPH